MVIRLILLFVLFSSSASSNDSATESGIISKSIGTQKFSDIIGDANKTKYAHILNDVTHRVTVGVDNNVVSLLNSLNSSSANRLAETAEIFFGLEKGTYADIVSQIPKPKSRIWIMLSSSMSDFMIEQYIEQANKYGGYLVFRGVNEDETFKGFVDKHLQKFMKMLKGSAIQIDPRGFDAWGVSAVPAIIVSKEPICNQFFDKKGGYQRCKKAPNDSYCKVSGSVTLKYAMNLFNNDKQCSKIINN